VGGVSQKVTVSAAGQPKPAPFPGLPKRIRVGGNVVAPNLISQVKPAYPQSARDAGIEGIVHIQGIIAADGSLIGLRAVNNPNADLTNAAIEAAKQWRYRPALLNNEPIEVPTELEVEFKLVQ
jgi:protein TonB